MRSDQEIERLLEDWLADEAQPMPRDVLENALETVARSPQAGARLRLGARLTNRPIAMLAATGVLLLVVVAVGLSVDRIGSLLPVESASAALRQVWDPAADFRVAPNQRNPSPDSYGNPDVWRYLVSPIRNEPLEYALLSIFDSDRWQVPGVVTAYLENDGMIVHPGGGSASGPRFVILGWKSPVAADMTISGFVDLLQRTCPSPAGGVEFSINHESQTLATYQVPAAGRQDFNLHVAVARDEFIYFIVGPGSDNNCDSTLLAFTIETAGGDPR